MNIENIISLEKQLHSLGFENTGNFLLKRICFNPGHFFLPQKIEKGNEQLVFQFFIEKDIKHDAYLLRYYDATLQTELITANSIINDIDIVNLENLMKKIDWKNAFDFSSKKQLNWNDKASWEKELQLEAVMENISRLEITEEGFAIAAGLKLKYWQGAPYQELFGSINPVKSKFDISQRFYLFEGQVGISVDEAYRFLKNRLLEKQIHLKKKQTNNQETEETENDSQGPGNKGLLKKKRGGNSKYSKRSISV
ncbi:MAG: hypothetical protein JST86_12380 [Bacteroidetes bacterium]|nr:hypothetical protein [Bacteroidota bacterium]